MKAKYLWVVLITLVFFGCDDNTGGLGMGMLPGSDGITIESKPFNVITEDATSGAVFAKTDIGYVGRFTDNEYGFGYYEGSFLTELNCMDDLTFPKAYDPVTNRDSLNNMISNDIDESFALARLVLGYYSFFGDSLSPMQVSVYEIDKQNLEKNHYTDINPDDYTTKNILLGRKSFSAIDLADSLRHKENYMHSVSIPISDELGKRIIKENWDNPGTFKDSDTFKEFFKGLYITSDIGDGTVLYIQHVSLEVVFYSYQLDSKGDIQKKYNPETGEHDGADSTFLAARSFASTMEIIQANQIQISDEVNEKVQEDGYTYLKSPAGIYTRAILPIGEIMDKEKGIDLDRDTINSVKLVFNAYHHETTNEYSMSPPSSVLLIKESEMKEFFEKNKIPNNTTSYYSYFLNNQYEFPNIMRLITSMAKEMEKDKEEAGSAWDEEEWLDKNAVAIIPVSIGTSSSGTSSTITHMSHDLKPTYVKLKGGDPDKGGSPLELQVIYSRFNE